MQGQNLIVDCKPALLLQVRDKFSLRGSDAVVELAFLGYRLFLELKRLSEHCQLVIPVVKLPLQLGMAAGELLSEVLDQHLAVVPLGLHITLPCF